MLARIAHELFWLGRHVARAEHTAYVIYGTGLLDDLPRTPDGVARLSAFARLVGVSP